MDEEARKLDKPQIVQTDVMIERCASVSQPGWLSLREALWRHASREEHLTEMASFLNNPERHILFVAYAEDGRPVGFVEASVRIDNVNGTTTSPVAFLEGLYVVPGSRRKGVGRRLVEAIASWAVGVGCTELASDSLLEHHHSHAFHKALGFMETERAVFFNKPLRRA